MVKNLSPLTEEEFDKEIEKLTKTYKDQSDQLERAYSENDPVSWRKHPLSPLTPLFLSHITTNLLSLSKGQTKNPKIIDLGCGAGEKTDKLRSFSMHVIGVDNIDKPLKEARKLAKNRILDSKMRILKADILDLPFKDETFDGAHDYLSFLHIIREDWFKYIRSVHRVLKKGAPLLIVTFSGNDTDFYGYPINKVKDRGIIFTDKYYQGDKQNVAHLINSYFYFPKESEIKSEFKKHFEILDMIEIHHPLHKESDDHVYRKLWHILLRKR